MPTRSYVYILANKKNGTIYIGVTTNIARRVFEHKTDFKKGFTQKYNLHLLVHYEVFETITEAIEREKQLKHWKREWKIELIEKENPEWEDLSENVV
jgi:putative endonuclease